MKSNLQFTIILLFIALVIMIGVTYAIIIRLNGMQITSWWRTPWHNAAVGGTLWSLHQFGLGWDVIPVNEKNRELLAGLGLKVINEGDHLHAQIV